MADLIVTGPPALELKWGHHLTEEDGMRQRRFFPETRHREPRGYLHGGLAAAAMLGASHLAIPAAEPATGVWVRLERPTPLGTDLRVGVSHDGTDTDAVIEHLRDPETEHELLERTARGRVRFAGRTDEPDLPDARQLAAVPAPDPEPQQLFPGCVVCGHDNPRGLGLVPGWHAEGRVVSHFVADERYAEDGSGGPVSPIAVVALLSCPTLWACRHHLEAADRDAALLVSYEVRFHDDPKVPTPLRTVGWAGEPDEDTLRGASALVDGDGRVYASATASWLLVDEVPDRDPEGPVPADTLMPLKAGRPEDRSRDGWGRPLPGRREAPGPRSERPE